MGRHSIEAVAQLGQRGRRRAPSAPVTVLPVDVSSAGSTIVRSRHVLGVGHAPRVALLAGDRGVGLDHCRHLVSRRGDRHPVELRLLQLARDARRTADRRPAPATAVPRHRCCDRSARRRRPSNVAHTRRTGAGRARRRRRGTRRRSWCRRGGRDGRRHRAPSRGRRGRRRAVVVEVTPTHGGSGSASAIASSAVPSQFDPLRAGPPAPGCGDVHLDDGDMWPTSFAILKIGPAEEKRSPPL